ncbi:hypothetical protein L210DRAFT_962606 [Boletus edulis BED1]|uniref:Uncharacterized protein n=1 Tax=Boletus edulis BED1 TaxID=1328754 RepID=A0AAD4C0D1_BOLED|nr:hypothetical protein L210DRAFT_962606 [Boletus edulis BED1]
MSRLRRHFVRLGTRYSAPAVNDSRAMREISPPALHCIPCGRPRNHEDPIPPTLLHPVFNQFLHDCQTDIEIDGADDKAFADDLVDVMTDLYEKESDRNNALQEVFDHHKLHFASTNTGESKNEVAVASAEPYFQAIQYYVEHTRERATKYKSPLPCFLVCITGSTISFSGAAWNARPMAQPLSTPCVFHFHSSDSQNLQTATRHIAAFYKAAKSLEQYYSQLELHCPSNTVTDQLFPYPMSYTSLPVANGTATTTIKFQYDRPVVNEKLIFFATEESSKDKICIKFVQSYSKEAHECFCNLGHAPALRGFQKLTGGGWIMVVFDALIDLFQTVFRDIAQTLDRCHSSGFVHGDVRDVNIMVSKSGPMKFMFVDLDWQSIVRPEDALRGKYITQRHDIFMLQQLKPAPTAM